MAYRSAIVVISGKDSCDIMLYTLSTCIWCKKTKAYLADLDLEYKYIDVDLLDEPDQDEVTGEILRHNPSLSFPTIVVNNGEKVICGFREDEIKDLSS